MLGKGAVFLILVHASFAVQVQPLYSFERALVELPVGGVAQGADGFIYGAVLNEQTGRAVTYSIGPDGTRRVVGEPALVHLTRLADGRVLGVSGDDLYTVSNNAIALFRSASIKNGGSIDAPLVEAADGTFFGISSRGGVDRAGVVLEISAESAITLHSFSRDGIWWPVGPLALGAEGALYGACNQGGAHGKGAIFRRTRSGELSVVLSFDGSNGAFPLAGLIRGRGGIFYGTTGEVDLEQEESPGNGTVFALSEAGELKTLHRFQSLGGAYPRAALIETPDGLLHGTTSGIDHDEWMRFGTIFTIGTNGTGFREAQLRDSTTFARGTHPTLLEDGSIAAATMHSVVALRPDNALTSLTFFGFVFDPPRFPLAGLTPGKDGALYGATVYGGNGFGTLFRLSRSNEFRTLFAFSGTNGNRPEATLTLGPDEQFYGTTLSGGAAGNGVIYRMDHTGNVEVLHSFAESAYCRAPLVLGPDQRLYGFHLFGIFAISTNGAYTVLRPAGTSWFTSLIAGEDGALYGAASEPNGGSLFRLSTNGAYTLLYSFRPGDGRAPGPLLRLPDGTLLGVTDGTGDLVDSTVFRLGPNGTFETLARFDRTVGVSANPLAVGKDGAIYGTVNDSRTEEGALFRVSAEGRFTVLHRFGGAAGSRPVGRLHVADDGSLIGVASEEGAFNSGAIYRIAPPVLLDVAREGNQLRISWPAFFERFSLQSASAGKTNEWKAVSTAPERSPTANTVSLLIGAEPTLFRLKE